MDAIINLHREFKLGGIAVTQEQRRIYLIKTLLSEQEEYADINIPADEQEQKNSDMEVIFNVFEDVDYKIYRELLGTD